MPISPPRVGLIGAGVISRAHASAWVHLGADVLVYSLDGADALAEEFGIRAVPSLDDLWDHVDIIDIVTPTHTHADLAMAAIARRKHVVCEKPLALTPGEARRMVTAAAEAGVVLFPAQVVRYFPEYRLARRSILDGRIGRPAVARLRRQSATPAAAWFHEDDASGGIVMDQMLHDLDQAEWLLGPAVDVFARSRTVDEGDRVSSAAHVVLRHESGAISLIDGVWGSEHLPFSYSFDIAGDAGVLRFDSATADGRRLYISPEASGSYLPEFDAAASPYFAELADALAAMTSESRAGVTPRDGMRAVELAHAARESIRTGVGVPLPPGGGAASELKGAL